MLNTSEFAQLLQPLLEIDSPVFPQPALRQVGVHILWGVVLATAGWRMAYVLQPRWRFGLAVLVGLGSSFPGPMSPAYWLELAFASPSWTSVLLCGLWLWRQTRAQAPFSSSWTPRPSNRIPIPWVICGLVVGWVLALDTFAVLPIQQSVYGWGFSSQASLVLTVGASAAWVISARGIHTLPFLALALFVLTRLPSGNVWDAVLDPLLWLYLHICLATQIWRYLRGR